MWKPIFSLLQSSRGVVSHYESIKSLLPFSGGIFVGIVWELRGRMLLIKSPLCHLKDKVFNCQFIINLKWQWKTAFLQYIKIAHGIVLLDWILQKSSRNNCPACGGTAMFSFGSRQGLHFGGDMSPWLLWAPIRGADEQLEYLQLGLAKCDELFLSPF